jgi:hypothetical protein
MLRKQKNRKKLIRAAALLLITMYAVQVFNNAFYLHTHVITYGKVVTHAHPYNKHNDSEPVKSHTHTWEHIITLENLELLFPVFFLMVCLLSIDRIEGFADYISRDIQPASNIIQKGRSPPVS